MEEKKREGDRGKEGRGGQGIAARGGGGPLRLRIRGSFYYPSPFLFPGGPVRH